MELYGAEIQEYLSSLDNDYADAVGKNDGLFLMSYQDFIEQFNKILIGVNFPD
jgi:hypothetical protein